MHLIGLARLGRDVELRFLQDGTPVSNLALAFNYGKKDDQGNRPTQWIEGVLWGERAERLNQYLTKGTQLQVHLSEPHVETYTKNDGGQGVKLVARVDFIQFAGGGNNQNQQGGQQQQRPAAKTGGDYAAAKEGRAPANKPAPRSDFSDMDDDIPF